MRPTSTDKYKFINTLSGIFYPGNLSASYKLELNTFITVVVIYQNKWYSKT